MGFLPKANWDTSWDMFHGRNEFLVSDSMTTVKSCLYGIALAELFSYKSGANLITRSVWNPQHHNNASWLMDDQCSWFWTIMKLEVCGKANLRSVRFVIPMLKWQFFFQSLIFIDRGWGCYCFLCLPVLFPFPHTAQPPSYKQLKVI